MIVTLKKQQPKIIAAIPAYNEERHVGDVVSKTSRYVDQVFVIDDGSSDRTEEKARAAGAVVIRHHVNMGKGEAINTAFKMAREISPLAMVLLDGDNQHNPDEIPLLLKPIISNQCDMVVGSRYLRQNNIPAYRMLGQYVLTLTTNLGSGIKLTDSQSGFRAFSRLAINQMYFNEKGLSVESEMQFIVGEKYLKVQEVPISTNYNDEVKRNPVVHGVGVLIRVMNLIISRRTGVFLRAKT